MTSIAERSTRTGGRVPPHSLEAEESVLGAILMSIEAANEVMDKLVPDDFYLPAHQAIFAAIRTLYDGNQAIDAITVSEELRRTGELDMVGGMAYVTKLIDIVPSAANVEWYAGIVDEHAQRRALIRAGSTITDLALRLDDEVHAVVDRAEQTVLAVAGRKVGDSMVKIGPLFFSTLEDLEALEAQGSEVTGLSTGFRDLDRKLTGLHPANLVIIAARPAMGKCLVGETRVLDPKTGAFTRIDALAGDEDLRSVSHVLAYDPAAGVWAEAAPSAGMESGLQRVFEVTTRLGRRVTATAGHPLLTPDGWRPLRVLQAGSTIAVAGRVPVFGVDGVEEERLDRLARTVSRGMVPEEVFRLPRYQLADLMARVLGTDPSGLSVGQVVGLGCPPDAGREVQHLLLRFGVVVAVMAGGAGCVLVVERGGEVPDVIWDPVVSIEPAGERPTYDLTVPGLHNFAADDVVVHNSALTANVATNVAMTGKPVAIFSLEMSKEEVATRMLCSVARIDSMKLRSGQLGEGAWPRLTDAAGKLYNAPVYVDDSPVVTVTDIRAKCRRLKRAHGLELIVVDYLQLMQGAVRENRQQEIAEISRSLKNLARELELPVIAVSQLNRNLESREDKRPRLGDLRESGSLEQDADIVLFIYRDEYYNEATDKKGIAEVVVAKHRAGATGTVEMTFMPEFTRFSDIGRD